MATEPDSNLVREIDRCARYLIERRKRERSMVKSAYSPPESDDSPVYDKSGVANFLGQLESCRAEIEAAAKRLSGISAHFDFGSLEPFSSVDSRVRAAKNSAENALAEITIAQNQIRSECPPKTRELTLEKAAFRLAYVMKKQIGTRKIRAVASEIMLKAQLAQVAPRTLTSWLTELQQEDTEINRAGSTTKTQWPSGN
jgi:hypothetical protein